jgi:hypothetical protein
MAGGEGVALDLAADPCPVGDRPTPHRPPTPHWTVVIAQAGHRTAPEHGVEPRRQQSGYGACPTALAQPGDQAAAGPGPQRQAARSRHSPLSPSPTRHVLPSLARHLFQAEGTLMANGASGPQARLTLASDGAVAAALWGPPSPHRCSRRRSGRARPRRRCEGNGTVAHGPSSSDIWSRIGRLGFTNAEETVNRATIREAQGVRLTASRIGPARAGPGRADRRPGRVGGP